MTKLRVDKDHLHAIETENSIALTPHVLVLDAQIAVAEDLMLDDRDNVRKRTKSASGYGPIWGS